MRKRELYAWTFVGITWILGDLLSTVYGIQYTRLTETEPIARKLIKVSIWLLIPYKISGTILIYYISIWVSYPERIGVPIGLIIVGTYATMRNILLIL